MIKTPEELKPYNNKETKHKQIEQMFDNIAPAYDSMNRFMSFRLDIKWRRKSLEYLQKDKPQQILDIATGTGDLAIDIAKILKPKKIIGADLSTKMMSIASEKVKENKLENIISFQKEDCTNLSFEDNSFDAVSLGFGIRNFEDISAGLNEIYRVLKPKGRVCIIELSKPNNPIYKIGYNLYTKIIPFIGSFFSKDKKAYKYLPKSIDLVPQGKNMIKLIEKAGFKDTINKTYTFGVCSLYLGTK